MGRKIPADANAVKLTQTVVLPVRNCTTADPSLIRSGDLAALQACGSQASAQASAVDRAFARAAAQASARVQASGGNASAAARSIAQVGGTGVCTALIQGMVGLGLWFLLCCAGTGSVLEQYCMTSYGIARAAASFEG